MKLGVATSQFPVRSDVERNTGQVLRQMRRAREAGAHVVHFSEGALSGYAGTDSPSFRGFDRQLLESCSLRILELAAELRISVILGSSHRLTAGASRTTAPTSSTTVAKVGEEYHRLSGGSTYPEITMPATMQAAAAANHVWISCSNSSARYSCWPAFFVRADGVVTGRLRRHAANILLSTVDTRQDLYDSTLPWRSRAMRGVLHSGTTARDPRSVNRTAL